MKDPAVGVDRIEEEIEIRRRLTTQRHPRGEVVQDTRHFRQGVRESPGKFSGG